MEEMPNKIEQLFHELSVLSLAGGHGEAAGFSLTNYTFWLIVAVVLLLAFWIVASRKVSLVPSGIGKSTQAEIWMDMTNAIPINDDKPFLHITKTKTTAYGSPWNGKHGLGYNIHGTVRAIFALRQGTEPAIRRLDPEEALPVLLSQCPRPRDEDLLLKTIGLAATLAKQIPIFELRCARNDQAVRLAYRTLLEEGLIKDKGTGHRS